MTTRSKLLPTGAALSLAAVMSVSPGVASADAGTKPSDAPTIAVGQMYFGDTSNAVCGSDSYCHADLWRLPPVLAQDRITVAWRDTGLDYSDNNLCLLEGVDDFSWSTVMRDRCPTDYVSTDDSGTRSTLQAHRTSTSTFLNFHAWYGPDAGAGSYEFTVESIRHRVGLALNARETVKRRGRITGSARMTNSQPVPNGTAVSLVVTKGGGRWVYSDTAQSGRLLFKLHLPKAVKGKKVKMTLVRTRTSTWQAASSSKLKVKVR